MNQVLFGKTGMKVSKIGFGGIPIQRVSQSEVDDIIDELIKTKVNFIDTARGYTVSEEMIGNSISNRRDKFYLCTKSMARTYEAMKKDIDISLNNLKTDYIDLYQFHNVKEKDYEIIMSDNGAYKALLEAKQAGKVRHIGITSHSLDFLESISDNFLFESVQFPFNIVETKASSLFKKLKKQGVGIIVMKPLAGGAIDNKKLAIKFLLNQDCIDVIIPGMSSTVEVKENTSVKVEALSKSEEEEIEKIRKDLGSDFCRRCGYCLPCSKGIDIPNCFMFEGYYNRYGLKEWATLRYNSLTHFASECIECGACEKRCPYSLKIIDKMKGVKKIFGK